MEEHEKDKVIEEEIKEEETGTPEPDPAEGEE